MPGICYCLKVWKRWLICRPGCHREHQMPETLPPSGHSYDTAESCKGVALTLRVSSLDEIGRSFHPSSFFIGEREHCRELARVLQCSRLLLRKQRRAAEFTQVCSGHAVAQATWIVGDRDG